MDRDHIIDSLDRGQTHQDLMAALSEVQGKRGTVYDTTLARADMTHRGPSIPTFGIQRSRELHEQSTRRFR